MVLNFILDHNLSDLVKNQNEMGKLTVKYAMSSRKRDIFNFGVYTIFNATALLKKEYLSMLAQDCKKLRQIYLEVFLQSV